MGNNPPMNTMALITRTLVVTLAAPGLAHSAQAAMAGPAPLALLAAGAYFGMVGLLVAACTSHAVMDRDRNLAALALYLVLVAAAQAVGLGLTGLHLWPGDPEQEQLAQRITPGAAAAAGLWLMKVVAEPARFSRVLDMACWSFLAALLSAVAMHAFVDTRASHALVTGLAAGAWAVGAGLIALAWRQDRDAGIGWIALGFLPGALAAGWHLLQALDGSGGEAVTNPWALTVGAALQAPVLYVALRRRTTRRQAASQRAAELHHSDALTGLHDRRTLVQRMDDAMARARLLRHSCAVLGVRLSNHHELLDDLGRETANRALVVAASVLRQAASDIDVVARIGERDFALLIEGPTNAETALARAQQVVAHGLQEARALPRDTLLKFHVAVALLPDHELDARRCLKWMAEACDAMRADPRRAIRAINF